ncbi:hypothetical protein F5Y03DRAFT_398842 [Xylaria venustula]|nr:hypothetical protein F5Y03DRAFT_398842 [Xylaria venustula]
MSSKADTKPSMLSEQSDLSLALCKNSHYRDAASNTSDDDFVELGESNTENNGQSGADQDQNKTREKEDQKMSKEKEDQSGGTQEYAQDRFDRQNHINVHEPKHIGVLFSDFSPRTDHLRGVNNLTSFYVHLPGCALNMQYGEQDWCPSQGLAFVSMLGVSVLFWLAYKDIITI